MEWQTTTSKSNRNNNN